MKLQILKTLPRLLGCRHHSVCIEGWEGKSEDLERLPSHRTVESGLEQTLCLLPPQAYRVGELSEAGAMRLPLRQEAEST